MFLFFHVKCRYTWQAQDISFHIPQTSSWILLQLDTKPFIVIRLSHIIARPITIEIRKDVTIDGLDRRIKSLGKNTRVLKRLYFVRYRYQGYTVKDASEIVGVTEAIGYEQQRRWNKEGYEGLIPRFGGGKPPKLISKQKEQLKEELEGKTWTTEEVRELIFKEFGVMYTPKHVRTILKKLGMNHAKPYPNDHRRPEDRRIQRTC